MARGWDFSTALHTSCLAASLTSPHLRLHPPSPQGFVFVPPTSGKGVGFTIPTPKVSLQPQATVRTHLDIDDLRLK